MTNLEVDRVEVITLSSDRDVVLARQRVREFAIAADLDLVGQTKVITAASELARNTVIHGLGGELTLSIVRDTTPALPRLGLQLVFVDHGPGIDDVERALAQGWSSGTGLGLGLPGSRRLVHHFDLQTAPGAGTTVTVLFWRRDR